MAAGSDCSDEEGMPQFGDDGIFNKYGGAGAKQHSKHRGKE